MRKIFLDCGAWNGSSAEFFRKHHPEGKEFEIYSFECLPENIIKLKQVPDIWVIEKAVWIDNCYMRFYKGMTESGTFYKEKRTGNVTPDNNEVVEALDFAEFIRENFKKEDYIICKLNIEGAEYAVLPHLKSQGLLDWVDKWYIQWHWDKIKISKETHQKIKNLVPVHYAWNAMLNKVDEFKKTL